VAALQKMYTAAPAALASKYFVLCSQYVRCCAAYTQQAGGSRGMFVACVIAKLSMASEAF
jgi:hypothetical protein